MKMNYLVLNFVLLIGCANLSNAMKEGNKRERDSEEEIVTIVAAKKQRFDGLAKTTKGLEKNLGNLQLPDDMLAKIIWHASDSEEIDDIEQSFSTLSNICLTNKYLRALTHERSALKDRFDRLQLERTLNQCRYIEPTDGSIVTGFAAAILNQDYDLIFKILPKLKKLGTINQKFDDVYALTKVIIAIVSCMETETPLDGDMLKKVIATFLEYGAKVMPKTLMLSLAWKDIYNITPLLLDNCTCETSKEVCAALDSSVGLAAFMEDTVKDKVKQAVVKGHKCFGECTTKV